jgi:hypothetical protein
MTIFLLQINVTLFINSCVVIMKNRFLRNFFICEFFLYTQKVVMKSASKQQKGGLRYHWANDTPGWYLVLISKATWWLLGM